MAVPTERKLPSDTKSESDENGESVGILETQGTFNDFIVWGHETLPAADDTFVKGVEEWLKFAEVVCCSLTC
jgi:ribonuclease H2 subunit C